MGLLGENDIVDVIGIINKIRFGIVGCVILYGNVCIIFIMFLSLWLFYSKELKKFRKIYKLIYRNVNGLE